MVALKTSAEINAMAAAGAVVADGPRVLTN